MRALAFIVLTVPLLALGDEPKKEDKERLKGTWLVLSCKVGARSIDVPADPMDTWTFEKDQVVNTHDGKKAEKPWTFAIDPKAEPKTIDLSLDGKVVYQGIYEIDGQRLKVCYNKKTRPTRLDPEEAAKPPYNVLFEFEKK
ncbi:MAG TPA: TIGR03067 domain-containing protein [Isosphaeraceae bacterium]|jgi:uncharacterized protein (TIGR03067 family)|nr:TIGR03067 domain-containing protein [Isosphaeraceae bacterium]